MAEPEEFYRDFLPRFIDAQRAFHDGDPEPNLALWSTAAPVTRRPGSGRLRHRACNGDVLVCGVHVLRRRDLRLGDAGLGRGGGLRLHRGCRALYEFQGRWPCRADRAAGDSCLSPRGRALAGGAPTCRPQTSGPHNLTGDSISPTGLTASAGPRIGSARTRHRTCA
jgi:hypothetical protein